MTDGRRLSAERADERVALLQIGRHIEALATHRPNPLATRVARFLKGVDGTEPTVSIDDLTHLSAIIALLDEISREPVDGGFVRPLPQQALASGLSAAAGVARHHILRAQRTATIPLPIVGMDRPTSDLRRTLLTGSPGAGVISTRLFVHSAWLLADSLSGSAMLVDPDDPTREALLLAARASRRRAELIALPA